ncbi:hypothetical protein ACGFJT_40945 [Actinomadura geliboluensis]|uniref:hypothetical protein n=1 Tax=Actinomadura geliboluensis TaxID=882440 RepID=UPI0037161C50
MGSIVPYGSSSPEVRRDAGAVVPRTAPVHSPGEMGLGGGRLREECWPTVGERTRQRLAELSGNPIDWFAREDASSGDGRCYAVTLGEAGLSIAEPRVNTEHRPVYAITSFQFAPGSLRHVQVDHRPPPYRGGAPMSGHAAAPPDIGLGPAAKGVLGNLPPQAQELLQAPFTAERKVLRENWYYEGFDHRLDAFVLYLAGAKDVTFATGTKIVPAGHTDATAHWSLTCYRASVARRIGR